MRKLIPSHDVSRLYTTIENPSYFFMTLSCTKAIQSFISHFNQYSLGTTFPAWFDRGLVIDLESYGPEFDTTVILETEFHENNTIFISHPDKHKRGWKIVSTINVTNTPIQINWARNIASDYFIQQQPASSFTTVSNVMVLLCVLRHQ